MQVTITHPANPWFRIQPTSMQTLVRLFCFHHAGGAASVYRLWSQQLPADIEVCAVQPPGRETRIREAPFTKMGDLVQALLPQMQPYLDKPFALFGHSMGSSIAYEVAQTLYRELELLPTYLFVSGRRAPHLSDPHPHIHHLSDDDLLAAIQRRYGGIPDIVFQETEMKEIFAPLLRADFSLVERYQPSTCKPLPCPIMAFGGTRDAHATECELLAWQALTSRAFDFHLLPGGHFYLNEQRAVLLGYIAKALEKSRQSTSRLF